MKTWSFLFACLILLATFPVQAQGRMEKPPGPSVQLQGADGAPQSLSSLLAGRSAIVHFWATWCAPCRTELPKLAAFCAELDRLGLADRLILVSVDTRPRVQVVSFLTDELGLDDFDVYQGDSRITGALFRLRGYPATVFLGADGQETGRHAGPLDWSDPAVRKTALDRLR